jgi:hypothetical protein
MKNKLLKNWYIKDLKEKSMEDFKCESDARKYFGEEPFDNQTTGSNDNNWHWKTIGQGEGIQKVERKIEFYPFTIKRFVLSILWICFMLFLCYGLIITVGEAKIRYEYFYNNLPAVVPAIETKVCEVKKGIFTAYSPEERQTDSDPNINASGHRVQLGDIACPAIYSFGTKIEVLDKVYVCRDRMALKYRNSTDPLYFDIFLWNTDEARAWGRQELYFKIIK